MSPRTPFAGRELCDVSVMLGAMGTLCEILEDHVAPDAYAYLMALEACLEKAARACAQAQGEAA